MRQPVIVVLGHVDSGKTSLLDRIRGTAVQAREAGGITQHIGASFFPIETLRELSGHLISNTGGKIEIPGVLVIDTPGHEAFANLRVRGGSAADISIVVVDAMKGFEVQTYESIAILKSKKVPFIIALNKTDMIPGWKPGSSTFITDSLKGQDKSTLSILDRKIYEVVGSLSTLGFVSEAFNRVNDFTKEIAIVPVSSKTGEGIPEIIVVLIGLTQAYLKTKLQQNSNFAKGIVLEVKEEPGLGTTINLILLEGSLKIGSQLVLATRNGAIVSKIRTILLPKPLDEMRDPRDKFTQEKEVSAAAGVKIVGTNLEEVLAGSPALELVKEKMLDDLKRQVTSEVSEVIKSGAKDGIVLKADTLGSLEAIVEMLKKDKVPIRVADIGPVSRRDVIEALTVSKNDHYLGIVLSFGTTILPDASDEAKTRRIKIIQEPIIYDLVQNYIQWVNDEKGNEESRLFEKTCLPCELVILPGHIFRKSHPAIIGVELLRGRLRQKMRLMNSSGTDVGYVQQIQEAGNPVSELSAPSQAAVSIDKAIVGRTIKEKERLFTIPTEQEIKGLRERFGHLISEDERALLEELIIRRRKVVPIYGLF